MWQGIIGSAGGNLLLMLSGNLSKMGWYYPFLVYGFALLITLATYFFIYEPERKTQETSEGIPSEKAATDNKAPFPMKIMLQLALIKIGIICRIKLEEL